MATATLELIAVEGLTLTAELYTPGTDTLVTSAACTERTNNKAVYTCSIVDIATGTYRLRVRTTSGNNTIVQDWLEHSNATGTEYPLWFNLIWSNSTRTLTQSAAAIAAAVAGSDISIQRGDTVTIALTGLGDITGRSKLWFTVKRDDNHTDAQSVLQVEETGGLLYLNGATTTTSNATLVVDDAAAGDITITLKPAATATLDDATMYDIQVLVGAAVTTLTTGGCSVSRDVTRAVS